ncbi:GNAT family N-acetyltransferase [Rhodovulum sp. DZ06]|uniref:GNAT family N-acetyltransferase n=1 Tax=Rhodovulum sp. DZ06 TaxID=3425126 RepID=UPI003D34AA84
MPQVLIRRARPEDFPAIRALYAELSWGLENVSDDPALWGQVLHTPGTFVYVAGDAGAPLSMATLHLHPNLGRKGAGYAFVENVATLPHRRNEGLGRAVVEACVEEARAGGAYKVQLLTMRDGGARGFYEALGFAADTRWGLALRL